MANVASEIKLKLGEKPGTPEAGKIKLYPNLDGQLVMIDENGAETIVPRIPFFIDISYADLITAIDGSTLVRGCWYRITDYRTKHLIYDTTDINTAAVEPLIVLALAANAISTHAHSESYPQDSIEYDYSLNLAEDGVTARTGLITWRKDTQLNIECYYDWRTYKSRRYAMDTDTYAVFAGQVSGMSTDVELRSDNANLGAITLPYVPTTGIVLSGGYDTAGSLSVNSQQFFNLSAWSGTGHLVVPRADACSTLLFDGRIFITQGIANVGMSSGTLSQEIYDPNTGESTSTGNAVTIKKWCSSVLLDDGRVLTMGGSNASYTIIATCEIYDPSTGTSAAAASMSYARQNFASILLDNGEVLVVNGSGPSGPVTVSEIYNPTTNTWKVTHGSIGQYNTQVRCVRLGNGKILVGPGYNSANCFLYDQATETFASTGAVSEAVGFYTMNVLSTGDVLITGGQYYSGSGEANAKAMVYDVSAGTWSFTANDMPDARFCHTAETLPDGTTIIIGGQDGHFVINNHTCIYDPATNLFSAGPHLTQNTCNHTTNMLTESLTLDNMVSLWNAAHPNNTITLTGDGTQVPTADIVLPVTGIEWNADSLYSFGDFARYDGKLYYCYFDVTAPSVDTWPSALNWIIVANASLDEHLFVKGFMVNSSVLPLKETLYVDYLTFQPTASVDSIYIGKGSFDNVFMGDCGKNILGTDCYSNTFCGTAAENVFGLNCALNFSSSDFYTNKLIESCMGNMFADSSSCNILAKDANYNVLGVNTWNIELGMGCQNNVFGSDCTVNKLAPGCTSNVFGIASVNNSLGTSCSENTFDWEFISNVMGNECSHNTFGNGCVSNVFGDEYSTNTMGELSVLNTFGSRCHNNTFGIEFKNNRLGNEISHLSFVDSPYPTYVYSQGFCDIYTRLDGGYRLVYIDNSDELQVVDPTA